MGVYCYGCSECDHIFEARHSYKERLTKCPSCNKNTLSKLLNNPIKILGQTKESPQQTGEVVTKNIELAKQEIKEEQKILRKRVKK